MSLHMAAAFLPQMKDRLTPRPPAPATRAEPPALPGEDWYLAQLKPGGLDRARLNLGRQAFQTFMPMRPATVQVRGKPRLLSRALFPGYLFVCVPSERQDWYSINCTYGVSRIVALRSGCPTRVTPGLMRGLLAQCDGDTWAPARDVLPAGTFVRIVAGPFAASVARLAEASDGERVHLLMEMMGQDVRVTVARLDVERL